MPDFENMKDEIVLYQPNDQLSLEVKVENDTVWLNRNQMAVLFDRDVKTIGKHINNALQEELAPVVAKNAPTQNGTQAVAKNATPYENQVVAKFATTQGGEPTVAKNATVQNENPTVAKFAIVQKEGDRTVVRQVEYYSLDVILSVGYRVKSPRGIEFRRWANNVLREYVLRGHAINQRILAVEERVDNRLMSQERRLEAVEEKIDFFVRTNMPPVEQIFYNGQFFAARALLEKIIKTANTRVIVIDAYVDAATFEMLDVRAKGVKADIYSGKNLDNMQKLHNTSSGLEPIDVHIWREASHDRWLIIDDTVYHCGHSLKDMGQKLSAIAQLGVDAEDILKKIR